MWVKAFEESGKTQARQPPGRPRKIGAEQESLLQTQVAAYADDTLAQHCERWQGAMGVKVSIATMHGALKRVKLTRKKDLQSNRA